VIWGVGWAQISLPLPSFPLRPPPWFEARAGWPAQDDLGLDENSTLEQDAGETADGAIVRRVDLRATVRMGWGAWWLTAGGEGGWGEKKEAPQELRGIFLRLH
jgi:hypothetical protein